MKKLLFSMVGLSMIVSSVVAQNNVTVDFDNVIKDGVKRGASAVNLCWLLDSDLNRPNKHRSMEQAISEVGFGALRFPYGHLADNYFWHTAPYDDVEGGLRPKMATTSRPPSKWEWSVNGDRSFKNAMDFDEFMALCNRQDIAPLVVVNLLSHKYTGGPTIEELAVSAAEWVRYANKKGYKVKYWQIGNEIDHHPKTITLPEFVEAYKTIAAAMKSVDASAMIGPGILGKQHYFTALYTAAPELVDFTSCHQYMFSVIKSCSNYEQWSKFDQSYIPNVLKMQRAVEKSGAKDMDIVITETGVSPSNRGLGNINNTYKALWWFEVLMSELVVPNVAYSFFWGTHSPWKGEVDDTKDDVAVMFRVDDNSNKPIAEVSKLINANLQTQFVEATTSSSALRLFAMVSDDQTEGCIFIMNKQKDEIHTTLDLAGIPDDITELTSTILSGKAPLATKMSSVQGKMVSVNHGKSSLTLAPLSITVLSYKK